MCELPVFYATEGDTRPIAERLASGLRSHGLDSRAIPMVCEETSHFDWRGVRGVALLASVEAGRHQAEARAFAHLNADSLSAVPSLFVSISLAAVSSKPDDAPAFADAPHRFVADAGWQPTHVATLTGRHAATKYDWLVHLSMRRIAKREGAPSDSALDHGSTDGADVDRLADQLAREVDVVLV